ncbi:MAG: class I SAM-dependent methyltransferase [Actinomycetota bacterium]
MVRSLPPTELKSCCSALYEQDWVTALLGEHFHPGGAGLTRHLAEKLHIGPGTTVLDVACGAGASAVLLAEEFGARVIGMDRSTDLLDKATERARDAGVDGLVQVVLADAETFPLADQSVDALICECSFCTFPDKAAAAAEMARATKIGGRVGITDVTLQRNGPDDGLSTLVEWVACFGGALPTSGYRRILNDAGFDVCEPEDHSDTLMQLLDEVAPRLKALAALRLGPFTRLDSATVADWIDRARDALTARRAGYCLLTGRRAPD